MPATGGSGGAPANICGFKIAGAISADIPTVGVFLSGPARKVT